ncbi:MAG TPA: ATP-binding protein, partial [Isosphaeraceae bacterium]|nr:ATP-binding protein [Isosphaeraceae bacterium]
MSIEAFLQFADLLAEATLLVSGSGEILAANRSVAGRLGLDPAALRGRPLLNLVAGPPNPVARYLRACARTREMVPGALVVRAGDGRMIACRVEGAALQPRSGTDAALILLRLFPKDAHPSQFALLNQRIDELSKEVAKRRRAEEQLREQREWLRVTLSSIGDGVIATDTRGRVTFMNPIAEALTGWAEPEAIGKPLEEVFPIINEETREAVENPVARVIREGIVIGLANHTVLRPRNGPERAINDAAAPIRRNGGDLRGVVMIFRDDEERRRMERELRQRADRLAEADRQKNAFLAMLAHELRNPLAPIKNSLEVLRSPGEEGADLAWATEIIARQVRHLARLVDDLLDMSRITLGKIELRKARVALETLTAHALDLVRPLLDAKGHELVVALPPEPIELEVDPARMEQVLCNLLNNAAKYTEPGGRIELSAARDGDEVVLVVRDNGVGIAPEVLPRIFDLFVQADRSLDRAQGGLGIGLTLVRTLVHLHGGSIGARSEGPGRGSEFIVRLPALAPPAKSSTDSAATPPARTTARPRRVLVVDDNVDSAQSLGRLLRRWGHAVEMAHDGPSALAAVATGRPEVILLDIGLPGMDGYEIARQIRRDPPEGTISLVALTGYGQDDDRRRARDAGFDHHLIKPVDLDALRDLLMRD